MFVDDCGLFPTWVRRPPVPQARVPTLRVRVRGFEGPKHAVLPRGMNGMKNCHLGGSGIFLHLSLLFSRNLLESTAALGVHRGEALEYFMDFTED